ncbi:gag-pol polyprotein [Tanacetum coccineum]
MELCTTLQKKVLDLEKTKTTQANEIASLKRRVKKLEKKRSSRTHKLKRLYKVGLSARVESSGDEESLGEDASKQGRINAIDADEDITLVNVQDDADNEMFDVDALNGEEVFVAGQNENVVEKVVDAAQVSTAATTVTITTEEITLAQALEALKTSKPKFPPLALLKISDNSYKERDDLGKMKPKADIGIFIGYSETSRGFRIYNRHTKKIMETIHVKFDELIAMASEYEKHKAPPVVTTSDEQTSPISLNEADESNQEDSTDFDGNMTDSEVCMYALTASTLEPKNIKEAISDHNWIESIQDELHQFKRLDVWELVPRPDGKNIIAVKWLWKNGSDLETIVIRNKSRLVVKCYKQDDCIDFEESIALAAHLESV